ncbi:MAG TPA: hypothetical protein VEL51_06970 [Vicinamibacterales bacterium]|nr:hypothetical protein [Vicinamibacterales bacterium]
MAKHVRIILAATLLTVISTNAAHAAAVRSGATTQAILALVRGSAVGYDSVNKVYLVVEAYGVLWGRFVNASGTPLGAPFTIQANAANFAHFPRVAFSPDADGGAGGFLVTWHEGAPSVHGRMVSYTKSGVIGADTQLTGDVTWWEAGPAVGYSTVDREFLVAWRALGSNQIRAVRTDNTATPKAAVFNVTSDTQYHDNPSIAFNPSTDEFLVVSAGYNDPSAFAFVDAQRVKSGTGALVGGATRLVVTGGTYITDVNYNSSTGKYLAAWYALPAGAALGRLLNADGTLASDIITLSTRWKAYDALSIGYNRRSDTFFMVSHGSTEEDGGVELTTGGTPVDNGFIVTAAGGKGNFYPRLAASADDPNWLMSTSNNFTSTMVQLIAGTSTTGTPSTPSSPTSPTPSAPVSNPMFAIDTPSNNATLQSTGFMIAGWAVDTGTTSGTGVDVVACWAFPTNGAAAILAGIASYGNARPDVGAWLGSNFANSGYGLIGRLPAGTYTLAIYVHSTVSGLWAAPKLLSATVVSPASNPRMSVDTPAQNQILPTTFTIAGWALDLGSTSGTGVDTLHIWAYPASGAAPVFVGVANYGIARPDVAAFFGSSRFTNSGWGFAGSLAPGDYNVVVYAHSAVTGTFNNVSVVAVHTR